LNRESLHNRQVYVLDTLRMGCHLLEFSRPVALKTFSLRKAGNTLWQISMHFRHIACSATVDRGMRISVMIARSTKTQSCLPHLYLFPFGMTSF